MSSRELVSLSGVFPGLKELSFTVGDLQTQEVDDQVRFSLQVYQEGLPVARVRSKEEAENGIEWDWFEPSYRPEFEDFAESMGFGESNLFIATLVACRLNLAYFQRECQRHTLFRRESDPAHIYQRVKRTFSHKIREKIVKSESTRVFFFNDLFQEPPAGGQ